jgi:hypothetical protein|eukprot:COSAG01_NODE_3825_length_5630_cov_1.737675_8_plen_83_part_00
MSAGRPFEGPDNLPIVDGAGAPLLAWQFDNTYGQTPNDIGDRASDGSDDDEPGFSEQLRQVRFRARPWARRRRGRKIDCRQD